MQSFIIALLFATALAGWKKFCKKNITSHTSDSVVSVPTIWWTLCFSVLVISREELRSIG